MAANATEYSVNGYDTSGRVRIDLQLRQEGAGRYRVTGWTSSTTENGAQGSWNFFAYVYGNTIQGDQLGFDRYMDMRLEEFSRFADITLDVRSRSETRTYTFRLFARPDRW